MINIPYDCGEMNKDDMMHAEWLLENLEYGTYRCSKCGQMVAVATYKELNKYHPYCNECKSKMTIHKEVD